MEPSSCSAPEDEEEGAVGERGGFVEGDRTLGVDVQGPPSFPTPEDDDDGLILGDDTGLVAGLGKSQDPDI
jgi:hypothetical protein